ncbi:MAG: HEXXH motif-containing putative peptide modification protein [Blastocatellia bacterium]
MKRLDFHLQEFVRYTWVSDRAKNIWKPRIQEVINRGLDAACMAVLSGARPCALRVIAAWQLFELYGKLPKLGLTVEIFETREKLKSAYFNSPVARAGRPVYYNVVIGQKPQVADFKAAWGNDDYAELDRVSGYPECCRLFYQKTCIDESLGDTTWPMALNTLGSDTDSTILEIAGPPATNMLWRSLGVRAVNHFPCRVDCKATIELAEEFLNAGRNAGYSTQFDWLLEILSWPAEWSALHGIAEIKTPVLKIATDTDATYEKYIVRRQGTSYPEVGAQGLSFPYRPPGQMPVTDSESFKRGLANPITANPVTLVNIISRYQIADASRPEEHSSSSGTVSDPTPIITRDLIDWSRMAEPQDDQYDTQIALEFAMTRRSPLRSELYVRRPVADSPAIFDGAVAVRHMRNRCPDPFRHVNGPTDHPNIALAAEYVRRWPTVFTQFRTLMDSFHPMIDLSIPREKFGTFHGSSSHSEESTFGTMFATFYDPLGLAQAFVHEMAHHKLRALGISVETTTGLITNPPDELYASPIRKDKLRPMSAVFHAEYSFMYVTALDIKMIESESQPQNITNLLSLLARNVRRMEEGLDVIQKHIKTDADGRTFIDGFLNWAERVIDKGNALLDHKHLPTVTKYSDGRFEACDNKT